MIAPLGPCPTLWGSKGIVSAWRDARDLLVRAQPPAVQLHTWEPGRVASEVRRDIPGVRIVVGVGIDGIARDVATGKLSVERGAAQMAMLARRASDVGAEAIVWNAEAGWKRSPTHPERARIVSLVREGLAAVALAVPRLAQWHTAYDHPSYHSTYPWEAWLGPGSPVLASLPQVYAAPGDDTMAHRGALPAREARALASWAAAVRAGWVRPDAPEGSVGDLTDVDWHPYYQAHHVPARDTIAAAVGRHTVCLWAYPTRADEDGRRALLALCELRRRGHWTRDGVRTFQREAGLVADGVAGPRTLAALGIVS